MILTLEEFKKIRKLNWYTTKINNKLYNTTNQSELFWLDFVKNVFLPYYKKQNAVLKINDFKLTDPVYITDGLELLLPTPLESAVYYAKSESGLLQFSFDMPQILIVFISILVYIISIILVYIKNIKIPVVI